MGVLFIIMMFVPLWSIYLWAPQYPEWLHLPMYPNGLRDSTNLDLRSINELNHYIGMKKLYTQDFFEFSILRYIFAFFALVSFLLILCKKRIYELLFLILFVLFCAVAMVDFYRWEYDYGHNLDPRAAIKIPDMTYQPPLLGTKQLLNFTATSIPDIGGWMLIVAGILLLIVVIKDYRFHGKKR
jgi:copper chaperone NosL